MSRRAPGHVPAWQVAAPGTSTDLEEYVYVLTDERDAAGWPRVRLVNYLTPVDRWEQERLQAIKGT